MIFRYKIEWEFEVPDMPHAKQAIDQDVCRPQNARSVLSMENMTVHALEAVCSEDRIIPRKFKLPAKTEVGVSSEGAIKERDQQSDDLEQYQRDAGFWVSPRPSDSSVALESERQEEDGPPF